MPEEEEIPAESRDDSLRFDQKQIEQLTGLVTENVRDELGDLISDEIGGIRITGGNVSGGNGSWQIHERPESPAPELIPADPILPLIKRWSIVPGEADLTIKLMPNGGRVSTSIAGGTALAITGIDTEFPVELGFRLYVKFNYTVSTDIFTAELLCGAEWDTDDPFKVDGNGDMVYTEFYYPFGVAIAWNEALAKYSAIDYGEAANLMVMGSLAPDANLVILRSQYIRPDNSKNYGVFMVFPPAGDFLYD